MNLSPARPDSRAATPRATAPTPAVARTVLIVLAVWGAAAVAVSASGLLAPSRLAVVPIGIGGATAALIATYVRSSPFRAWATALDLRVPILFHLVRVPAGVGFLVLHAAGRLPGFVALPAGWGDIVAGLAAIGAAVASGSDGGGTAIQRRVVFAWNVVALLDILFVVASVQRTLFFSGAPESLAVMGELPMALLPTFVVPLVFATHALVFVRLARRARDAGENAHPVG